MRTIAAGSKALEQAKGNGALTNDEGAAPVTSLRTLFSPGTNDEGPWSGVHAKSASKLQGIRILVSPGAEPGFLFEWIYGSFCVLQQATFIPSSAAISVGMVDPP